MTFRHILAGADPGQDTVLTIGAFDGIHLGHQHLLKRLIQRAQPGCQPGVITFSNHPATVLRPDYQVPNPPGSDLMFFEGPEGIHFEIAEVVGR